MTMASNKKFSVGKLLEWFYGNPLAEIARQYPIHLSDVPGKKIIIVATRGPERGKDMAGGMAPALMEACKKFAYKFWYSYGEVPEKGGISRLLLAAFNAWNKKTVPILADEVHGIRVRKVKAEKEEWDGQYNEFCNRWVWPICHNLQKFAKDVKLDDFYYNQNANDNLAKRIKQDLNGDSKTPIWIHDYHHMFLASALRRHGVGNPIVYFHHIPLPTLETLQKNPREKNHFIEMVKSMKACDAVVFQTEEVTKRFYELINQIMPGENPEETLVEISDSIPAYSGHFIPSDLNGRPEKKVFIGHAPISINTKKIMEYAADPVLRTDKAKALDAQLVAENIFINFERCDYSKGILERVKAFEQLLEENPDLRGKTQLVLGAQPTREGVQEFDEYAKQVNEVVERLNSKYKAKNKDTVIFCNERIEHDDVMRLMKSREGQRRIGLVTPYEDGMNLTAKEYAAAQDLKYAGPLVLSSGAGTAKELALGGTGAIIYEKLINGNVDVLVAAMKQAVYMSQDECNARAAVMQAHLHEYGINKWINWHDNMFAAMQNGAFFPKSDNDPTPQLTFRAA